MALTRHETWVGLCGRGECAGAKSVGSARVGGGAARWWCRRRGQRRSQARTASRVFCAPLKSARSAEVRQC
eukprot:302979-Rhodomonas_salina.1